MDTPGGIPGGVVSEIMNVYTHQCYVVSTAPELGQDYWVTALIPVVERKALFGLLRKSVPDITHQIATWVRNCREEAYQVHGWVREVVTSEKKEEWFDQFPRPGPPDGYSEGARRRLRGVLGDDWSRGVQLNEPSEGV